MATFPKLLFICYLLVSTNCISISNNRVKIKRLSTSSKAQNLVQRNKILKIHSHYFSKHSRTTRAKLVFTISIIIGSIISVLATAGAVIIAAISAVLASTAVLTALAVALIGGAITFGALSVKEMIDARKREYAHNLVELYNNQLQEKGRLCYTVKNINAIMDDHFELSLFKNHVDYLNIQEVFKNNEEELSNLTYEVSSNESNINLLWESNKDFEMFVCTKSIDLIGETRYLKNRITSINPKIYNSTSLFSKIWSSFKTAFKIISPFFVTLIDSFKEAIDSVEKMLEFKFMAPDDFALKIFEHNDDLKKNMKDKLNYDPKTLTIADSLNYEYYDYKLMNFPTKFFNPKTSEECDLNPVCILNAMTLFIPHVSDYYTDKIDQELATLEEKKKVNSFLSEIKKNSIQIIFDIIYVTSLQLNIVGALKEAIRNIVVSYDLMDQVEDQKKMIKSDNLDLGDTLKNDMKNSFIKDYLIEQEQKYFAKSLGKGMNTMVNKIHSVISDIENRNVNLLLYRTEKADNIEKIRTLVKNQLLSVMKKSFFLGTIGLGGAFYIFLSLATTLVSSLTGIDGIKNFIEIGSVIATKLIAYIPVIGMIYFVGKSLYSLITQIYKYNIVKKELRIEDKLIQNYNMMIINHVDYLIPKYLINSISNLDKMNTFVKRETLVRDSEFSFNKVQEDTEDKTSLTSFKESLMSYIKIRCKVHANFCMKYFTSKFFNENNFFETPEEDKTFQSELMKIFTPIFQWGPISDLVVVDDNFLNSYGFVNGNAGYRMFRGLGKSFGTNVALLYCRGCYVPNNMYLSYFDLIPNFQEQDTFENFDFWFYAKLAGKTDKCQDLNFVDNTMAENDGKGNYSYSYFNACYRKVDPNSDKQIELVRSIHSETKREKKKKGSTFKYPQEFLKPNSQKIFDIYATINVFKCYEYESDVDSRLLKKEENQSIDDMYYYEQKDSPKFCLQYLKSEEGENIEITGKIMTIMDNFIIEKLHKIEFYKRVEANEGNEEGIEPIILHTTKKKLKLKEFVPATYKNKEGKDINEFDSFFHFPDYNDKKGCVFKKDQVVKDLKSILKVKKVDGDNNCFSKVISEFEVTLCDSDETSKIKESGSFTKSGLPKLEPAVLKELKCEAKMLYDVEDESIHIFRMKADLSFGFFSRNACTDLPMRTTLDLYNKDLTLESFEKTEYWKMNPKGAKNTSIKSLYKLVPTLEVFKKSLRYLNFSEYGLNTPIKNLSPIFTDFVPWEGRDTLPKEEFYKQSFKISSIPKDVDCFYRSKIRIIFPLQKDVNDRFYIKNLGSFTIKKDDDSHLMGTLQSLVTVKLQSKKFSGQFSSFSMEELPINKYYFAEAMITEDCNSYDKLSIDPKFVENECNLNYLLAKTYIPYYPDKTEDGKSIIPPPNMMFKFPYLSNVCLGFRIWIKLNYDDLHKEKDSFCGNYNTKKALKNSIKKLVKEKVKSNEKSTVKIRRRKLK